MARTRGLQTYFQICYWILGDRLEAERVNPLVEKFIDLLIDFKVEKNGYKAKVSRVTNNIFEKIDSRWVKAACQLTFNIYDSQPSSDPDKWGLSHNEGAAIHQGLQKLSLSDGKYSHKVDFVVKDTVESSTPPMSRENSPWPTERW